MEDEEDRGWTVDDENVNMAGVVLVEILGGRLVLLLLLLDVDANNETRAVVGAE